MKKEKLINRMKAEIPAISQNEGLARAVVGAFFSQADPTIDELTDIKCSVSEAVTNSIVHGYKCKGGTIYIECRLYADMTGIVIIKDKGCGIEDIPLAVTPLYTTDKSGERSGMGFAVMQSFCDRVRIASKVGKGTKIVLEKKLSQTDKKI